MGNDDGLVIRQVDDGVGLFTLNRPERHNAWTVALENELFGMLADAAEDPAIRAIVITGAGRSFCPGMDMTDLAGLTDGNARTRPDLRIPMTFPTTVPKPVIAAINGACAGIGLVLALNCDLRFASATAKLTTSFAPRGIMAEHGIAWTLPRLVGTSKALDLLFSARIVMGQEALDLGLVDRIHEPGEVLDAAMTYARGLAATSSPLAMGVMKRQVYRALDDGPEASRTLALRHWMDHVRPHPDFTEGVASFLEKRPPKFAPWNPATPVEPAPLPD